MITNTIKKSNKQTTHLSEPARPLPRLLPRLPNCSPWFLTLQSTLHASPGRYSKTARLCRPLPHVETLQRFTMATHGKPSKLLLTQQAQPRWSASCASQDQARPHSGLGTLQSLYVQHSSPAPCLPGPFASSSSNAISSNPRTFLYPRFLSIKPPHFITIFISPQIIFFYLTDVCWPPPLTHM